MRRYLLIFAALALFLAPKAQAAVSFVSESHATSASENSATTPSITVSGTNPVLVIATIVDSATAQTTAVTWSGGGTATLIKSVQNATDGYADIWCIAGPPVGTGTVNATFSGTQNVQV